MCGIAGFFGPPNASLLRSMCDSLHHRGPDDEGFHETEHASLSMRRLAIIDLKTGHQPICNENGDVWVVFNGEIYNYEPLRQELIKAGHVFRTKSDTETIVHAYEEFGLDFVQHLHGMFGIAIWDQAKRRLVLARDRIGEKPLFYRKAGDRILFGSEIKAVLKDGAGRSVDPQAVCDFFCAGYVTEDRTFYADIKKLRPGEMAVITAGDINVSRYWSLEPKGDRNVSFPQACVELEEELLEAVRLCLKSDVEVASFLSGGVDSSLIVALMHKLSADIQTFSVGYAGEATGFNELNYAKIVSDHVGTRHHELILDAHSNIQLLPKIIHHYDEPHGEPTSMLVYLLCEFVQKHVKVALSGTGGDELFMGYPRHAGLTYLHYYQMLPKFLRRQVIERIAGKLPESSKGGNFAKRVKRFVSGSALPPAEAYSTWVKLLHPDIHSNLVAESVKSLAENPEGDRFLARHLLREDMDIYDRVAALDVGGYLAEYQLGYMDRMSMANSLEVRAPLCDYRLAEYATSLPSNFRMKGTRSKHILKAVARKYLPEQIVERKKVGFDSPIGQWFKDELRPFISSFLAPEQVGKTGLLNPVTVQALLADHLTGRKNYSLQLWSIVALETWHRMYIEDNVQGLEDYSLGDIRGVPDDFAATGG